MKKVFFDTWGWVAIAHKNDTHHEEVVSFYESFILNKGIPVTTDYLLAETITLLRGRTEPEGIIIFINALLAASREGRIFLERINEKRWEKAWSMSRKYGDKPYISFFDLSSFVVMKEMGLKEVLTADRHFEEVGLGFKKLF